MAILNNILRGQLKGRIGTTWFAHAKNSKGRPVTRAGSINENPTNPKTYKQMEQRARFANAVKFYTRATQNFFKFAYEDKKANESDYNAFMRHNIERSLVLPKDRVDAVMFPALGNRWMMSQGSLSFNLQLEQSFDENEGTVIGLRNVDSTVGGTSKKYIDNLGMKAGDIITIVLISSYVTRENAKSLDDVEFTPQWQIYQFVVDTTDTTELTDIPHVGDGQFVVGTLGGDKNLTFQCKDKGYSCWFSLIVTRKEKNSVKATTSYLTGNVPAQQLAALYIGSNKINDAATSWGAVNSAILKGGIATRVVDSDSDTDVSKTIIAYVNNQTPPAKLSIVSNATRTIKVNGSNLPSVAPTSSSADVLGIQDFEVNDSETEATFSITGMNKAGSASINYAGKVIAEVTLTEPGAADTDA